MVSIVTYQSIVTCLFFQKLPTHSQTQQTQTITLYKEQNLFMFCVGCEVLIFFSQLVYSKWNMDQLTHVQLFSIPFLYLHRR